MTKSDIYPDPKSVPVPQPAYRPLQAAFNKAYIGVITQGVQSMNDDGCCAYRGPDGRKCGIGYLIPDSHYSPEFDNVDGNFLQTDVENLLNGKLGEKFISALVAGGLRDPAGCKPFLVNLQTCHDYATEVGFIDSFKRNMAKLADRYSLTVPDMGEALGATP